TDTGKFVEAHQCDSFGYNLPPLSLIDPLIDQEVTDWFNAKYPDAASVGLGFFDAMAAADFFDAGVPAAAIAFLFNGLAEDTVFNMILDVTVVTASYPDIFIDAAFKKMLKINKLTPFDAYTIWFENYNLGHSNTSLAQLYNIQVSTLIAITERVTALYVPVDQIEQRLRVEWRQYFEEVKAVDELGFENYDLYYKYIIDEVHIPFVNSNKIRLVKIAELNSFLGIGVAIEYVASLKNADPEWGKRFEQSVKDVVMKNQAYHRRIWPLRYNGFYEGIKVNLDGSAMVKISAYDIDEALGVLSEIGEDGKSMLERASGFSRDEIKEIITEERASYGYGSSEIAAYEIFVKKSKLDVRRFFLHLQKEGAPVVTTAYDNLIYLQNMCAYDNFYGTAADSYTGRTGFATERILYSARADLLGEGFTDTDINRLELNLLQSVYALTMGESGIGWIITDPSAIGFLQEAPGIYNAYLVDGSKIAKGFEENAMVEYYSDASGSWGERGFVTEDFIVVFDSPTAITWVEGLSGETVEIKSYARPNIENAFYDQGLLYNVCLEGNIDMDSILEMYGFFGMVGEYTYQYFLAVKTTDGKFYYVNIDVLKEGIDPATYDTNSIINLRGVLHAENPSLIAAVLGFAVTDTNKPVIATQHHSFGYNLPPFSLISPLIDEEVTNWFYGKYPDAAAAGLGFFDALAITDFSDISGMGGVPWATLEYLFGIPENTVFNIAADVNDITGSYPDIFDADFKQYLRQLDTGKLFPFEAYTIWFMSYNLGIANIDIAELYNIKIATVAAIVDKVTAFYVPVDQIEQRLREEWRAYFDAVSLIDEDNFASYQLYFKDIIDTVHIPFAMGNNIRVVRLVDLNGFLGSKNTVLLQTLKTNDPVWAKIIKEASAHVRIKGKVYSERFWPLRYNGFYADIVINKDSIKGNELPEISPYDIDEALGVLSGIGEDGKSMLERAAGFSKDEIVEIKTEEYGYGTDGTAVYEIIVTNSVEGVRRFWLSLQKEGAPDIISIYNDLVTLKDQSIYPELYGTGQDFYTGRAGYATNEGWYTSRATLIEREYTETEITQIELNLLKSVYAATMDENGIGWVVTDPAAVGFIEVSSGMYKAKLADISRIAKGYSLEELIAFYADSAGPWV
ncbi:MAG: hypothetical protein KAQ99_07640, partial [Candidatus Aureabacteria bacterium]|nr:hypothetical protein [Candidatus Auribacterota bacterium]